MRYLILSVAAFLGSLVSAEWMVTLYYSIVPFHGGTFLDLSVPAIGIPLSIIFTLPLLITTFGDSKRNKVLLYAAVAAGLVELVLDLRHIYLPIGLFVSGAALGWLLRYIATATLGNMPTFQGWKKYF